MPPARKRKQYDKNVNLQNSKAYSHDYRSSNTVTIMMKRID